MCNQTLTPSVKRGLFLCFVLFFAANSFAQGSFSVFDVDAANFPTMKAKFYAFDANGNQQSPNPSDITITEDGIPRTVLSVTCPPPTPPRPVSIAMSLDISSSMDHSDYGGIPRQLGKRTFSELVPKVINPLSEFAFHACDNKGMIIQDFTSNRVRILDVLSRIPSGFGNDFTEQLLNQNTGILNIAKKGKYQRFAILYTDAWWSALSQSELQRCIDTCSKYGITFFAVIYTRPEAEPNGIKASLSVLAKATGGALYDGITSDQEAKYIATILHQQTELEIKPCEISWRSELVCIQRNRNLNFSWGTHTAETSYSLSANMITSLGFSTYNLFFHSKPIGVRFDTTITLTAVNSRYDIADIVSENPDYDINPKSFTLDVGESKAITISFTPSDSNYSWTRFVVKTNVCDQEYYASAGYPGREPAVQKLNVNSPNGAEIFVAGSDTSITWSGISPTEVVRIHFSSDAGLTWTLITDTATGGLYRWHVPSYISSKCLIKVTQTNRPFFEEWATYCGANNHPNDGTRTRTICSETITDKDGNIYATGYVAGRSNFSDTLIASDSNRCALYVAKYDINGKILWVKTFTGSNDVIGQSIALDSSGNIYIGGFFNDTVVFGPYTLIKEKNISNYFLLKLSSNSLVIWAQKFGAASNNSNPDDISIEADPNGNIYATGQTYSADFSGIYLACNSKDIFLAKYLPNGSIGWVHNYGSKRQYQTEAGAGNDLCIDKNGDIYLTGYCYDSVDFQGVVFYNATAWSKAFLARFTPDGDISWVKAAQGVTWSVGSSGVEVDNNDNVFIVGASKRIADFQDTVIYTPDYQGYIAQYKKNGDFVKLVSIPGTASNYLESVECSIDGSLIASGGFAKSITIDSREIKSSSPSTDISNIYVLKLSDRLEVEWVRTAGGFGGQLLSTSCLIGDDRVCVGGSFAGKPVFGNDILAYHGNRDGFIWCLNNQTALQSDTSDTVFSIVMPQYVSTDIDMGKVVVAKAKDSVITTFIRNTGTYPFRVDSIWLTGSGAFSLVSGIPPFDVPAGASRQVEFRFRPPSVGIHQAQITIKTQADTIQQSIRGEGVLPQVQALGEVIDFGQVSLSSTKDTIINVAIQNIGTAPVNFTGDVQLGPDMTQYSVLAGGGAFTLQPNESRTVTLRFAPQFIGRSSGRIGFTHDAVGSPATLTLFGWGIGGEVYIPDDSAAPGDRIGIPIMLGGKVTKSYSKLGAVKFKADVEFNSSILAPDRVILPSVIDNGRRTLTVEASWDGSSDTLTTIPFITALGDAETTTMNIPKFEWLDGFGTPLTLDVETRSGNFIVSELCREGGTRLIFTNGEFALSQNTPNPASGYSTIDYELIEEGYTELKVIDVIGRDVSSLYAGFAKPGKYSVKINTQNLSTGKYFYILRTPTIEKMRMMLVEH